MRVLVGSEIEWEANFTDKDHAAFDPTSLEFRVRKPSGAVTEYTPPNAAISNPAVGTWVLRIEADVAGTWTLTAASTAALQKGVKEWTFEAIDPVNP